MREDTSDSVSADQLDLACLSTAATRSAAAPAFWSASRSERSLTARSGRGDRRCLDPLGIWQPALQSQQGGGPRPIGDRQAACATGAGRTGGEEGDNQVDRVLGVGPRRQGEQGVGLRPPGAPPGRGRPGWDPRRGAAPAWSVSPAAWPDSRSARGDRRRGTRRSASTPSSPIRARTRPKRSCLEAERRSGSGFIIGSSPLGLDGHAGPRPAGTGPFAEGAARPRWPRPPLWRGSSSG